jgi:hypothetical protein
MSKKLKKVYILKCAVWRPAGEQADGQKRLRDKWCFFQVARSGLSKRTTPAYEKILRGAKKKSKVKIVEHLTLRSAPGPT